MPLALPKDAHAPVLSQFSLEGKVAAVTGGARGIGLEVCRGLAEAGASVALIYTSSKNAPDTAHKMSKETGSVVKAYRTDVKSKQAITATINQIAEDFGRLDVSKSMSKKATSPARSLKITELTICLVRILAFANHFADCF